MSLTLRSHVWNLQTISLTLVIFVKKTRRGMLGPKGQGDCYASLSHLQGRMG
jgi:hypothetical protein